MVVSGTGFGLLNVALVPFGRPDTTVNRTVPLKPFRPVRETVEIPVAPAGTVTEPGAGVKLKSPAGAVTVTVKSGVTECGAAELAVPVTLTV